MRLIEVTPEVSSTGTSLLGINPLFEIVAVPICSATSAFPYSTLFGFVNVAGLIGTATSSKDGLQLKDVAFKSLNRTVNGNSELNLGYVNGLVFIRNRSSSFRYLLFFCSKGYVTPIVNVETIPQSLAYNENGELVFTNGSSSNRSITVYWMSLPDIS